MPQYTIHLEQFLLEARQMGLLSELKVIYPIERAETGEFSIKGIELPPLGELR